MSESDTRTSPVGAALVLALLAGGVAVRGLDERPGARPGGADAELSVAEPMQLLHGGGDRRLAELDAWIGDARREEWVDARTALVRLVDCPSLEAWLETLAGQRFERLVVGLERGSAEEALGALASIFELGRRTRWDPGYFGGPRGAERLGGLVADWLDQWGARAATDPLLYDPGLAAVLVYGRAMRVAYQGNLFRSSRTSAERARAVIRRHVGVAGDRTPLGVGLERHFPGAFAEPLEAADFLVGFAREAELAFPGVSGTCQR